MPARQGSDRASRLSGLFSSVIDGKRLVDTQHDASLFLEATSHVADSTTPASIIERLINSKAGLETIQSAVRKSFKPDFILNSTLPFLKLLSDPQIKSLGDGIFLAKVLDAVLVPCSLWTELLKLHQGGKIQDDCVTILAWLCFEIISSESKALGEHQEDVQTLMQGPSLLEASSHDARVYAYRIQKIIHTRFTVNAASAQGEYGPGGRHDNDCTDFRDISIYPTNDELLSSQRPFLQRLHDVFGPLDQTSTESSTTSSETAEPSEPAEPADSPVDLSAAYLDWLFRLLREDMVYELREDLQVAMGKVKGRRRPLTLGQLEMVPGGENSGPRGMACTLTLRCGSGMGELAKMSVEKRKKWLASPNAVFKHGALGTLCVGATIIAFGSMKKDDKALLEGKTTFGLQITEPSSMRKALKALWGPDRDKLVLHVVNTPTFAYEPILRRLKELQELPLDKHLLEREIEGQLDQPAKMRQMLRNLQTAREADSKVAFQNASGPRSLQIGGAQLDSIINGLESPLALIQGPPGTGKSFLGALIILQILKQTNHRVLVLSFTNHALDQFLSDLTDIGVNGSSIVRLGSKASAGTESMKLENRMKDTRFQPSQATWATIKELKTEQTQVQHTVHEIHQSLSKAQVPAKSILDWLDFSAGGSAYWAAFQLPSDEGDDGGGRFHTVLANSQEATPENLYDYWRRGMTYPLSMALLEDDERATWMIPPESRKKLDEMWSQRVRDEQIEAYAQGTEDISHLQHQIDRLYDEAKRSLVRGMRVIGCTTTGAAMFQSLISTAAPDVVMVEEAGEILEAHIVAALSPSVKQLILIGDHKQLRPKVNCYPLTVEKGDGYDLNVSMFERLIRQGHPYTTLHEQHRSHPAISHYARLLAYEHLEDAAKTLSREPVKGLRSRVVFMHHEKPEDEMDSIADRRDQGSTRSKRNLFEAEMVLKTVRYLAQQGYKTQNLVVLTPYLGQLTLLKDLLSAEIDPVLNDLDSHELLRAGLTSVASTKVNKNKLRLSTIDNYQGEESDIVIASLTRSNAKGDIGFMSARERLVVLMSRAREGIILFGNMHTFLKSKKGHALWTEYFDALKAQGSLFDGLPVRCERHPDRAFLLSKPEDFDQHCPDGGCAEKCGETLSCGKHVCQRKCHRLLDHSQTPCHQKDDKACDRGHKYKVSCGSVAGGCRECARQDAETKRRIARDLDLERARQEKQSAYAREVQDLDDAIDHQRRLMQYQSEEKEQSKTLEQKRDMLQNLKETQARLKKVKEQAAKSQASQNGQTSSKKTPKRKSSKDMVGAQAEWEQQKASGARNAALDKLMDLIGLESIKDEFLLAHESILSAIRQGRPLSEERFGCSLLGNPGTGKTTVARIWGEFLALTGAIPGNSFKETTGAKLASNGVPGCEKMLEDIKNDGGGVVFIDEAYQLTSGNSPGGKAVLDFLLPEVENLRGKVVFVLAGYDKEMESFFAHNPGLPSRFPMTFKFADYTDAELLRILQRQIDKKFKGRVDVEGGTDGLYARIVSRRIGRGRGRPGFGNARAVENTLSAIIKRQVKNIREAKRSGRPVVNEMCLTKEDMIGPEPRSALQDCPAWEKLQKMIGLAKVKEELGAFQQTVIANYDRELDEAPLIDFSLNRVFLGPPGTGKTTVAKLYGQILAHLGLLSNGEVVVKNPSDFVGAYIGHSEAQTKGILAATVGKVLVIDEAYGLYGGAGGGHTNSFKTAVIDTIVADVQSVPGDDRCVLLLGYDAQMQEMFQKVNPGLSRRFPMSSAFVFEEFDNDALAQILHFKLEQAGFRASGEARAAALDVLARARNRPNFGNAGEIDILLDRAKASHQKRRSSKKDLLEAIDFDSDYDRASRDTDVKALFRGDVGREKVVEFLEGLQQRVKELKSLGLEPKEEIPFSFLFRGPPGTGKTTTARKMGKVYYDMGFLATAEVIECSASDMIAQYIGQTGPKVRELMDKALGKVLFIDEAYRLSGDHFAKEAVDELVDCVTKPAYQGRLIIILAGYVHDINKLLSVNPGLSSRFPDTVDFLPLGPKECFGLLHNCLATKKKDVERGGKKVLDISCLETPSKDFQTTVLDLFTQLSGVDGWASGRDVKQIAKSVFRSIKLMADEPKLEEEDVLTEMSKFLAERSGRTASRKNQTDTLSELLHKIPVQSPGAPPRPTTSLQTCTKMDETTAEEPEDDPEEEDPSGPSHGPRVAVRDAGVSDEVWEQLELDKAAEAQKEAEYQKLKASYKKATQDARDKILKQLLEEEDRKRREAAMKEELAKMGRCPMGYAWIKQASGFRCAGGSHFIGNNHIEAWAK